MKHQHSSSRELRISRAPHIEVRKNVDGSRTLSGTAVVWDALSQDLGGFRERISKGAFAQSLKDNPDVIIAYQHDLSQPLGRVSSGTARVWEDAQGLQYSCVLPDTTYAQNLISLIERGDISQNSFGFSVAQGGDEWSVQADGSTLRTVNQATLWECSVVTTPAYSTSENHVSLRTAPAHVLAKLGAWAKKRATAEGTPRRKLKKVAGEKLPKENFAYQGSDNPSDWKLPIKFSTAEKSASHVRNAIARWADTDMPDPAEKDRARSRIEDAAKAFGIDLAEGDLRMDVVLDETKRAGFPSIDPDDWADDPDNPENWKDDSGNDSDSDGDAGDSEGTDTEDEDEDRCACRCAECRAENCDGCSLCEDDEMCDECAAFQKHQKKQRESERNMFLDLIIRRL